MKYLKIDFVTPSVKTLSNFCTFFLQVLVQSENISERQYYPYEQDPQSNWKLYDGIGKKVSSSPLHKSYKPCC
jgi:hypothetical protein